MKLNLSISLIKSPSQFNPQHHSSKVNGPNLEYLQIIANVLKVDKEIKAEVLIK